MPWVNSGDRNNILYLDILSPIWMVLAQGQNEYSKLQLCKDPPVE